MWGFEGYIGKDKTQVKYLKCCYLGFSLKIQLCGYLNKKNKKIHFHLIRKNPRGRILRIKLKEQYLSTVPKSCPIGKMIFS